MIDCRYRGLTFFCLVYYTPIKKTSLLVQVCQTAVCDNVNHVSNIYLFFIRDMKVLFTVNPKCKAVKLLWQQRVSLAPKYESFFFLLFVVHLELAALSVQFFRRPSKPVFDCKSVFAFMERSLGNCPTFAFRWQQTCACARGTVGRYRAADEKECCQKRVLKMKKKSFMWARVFKWEQLSGIMSYITKEWTPAWILQVFNENQNDAFNKYDQRLHA